MSFIDLEKKIQNINIVPFNEICIWYKIMNMPQSTTRDHCHPKHNLYPCYSGCDGLQKNKDCYKVYNGKYG